MIVLSDYSGFEEEKLYMDSLFGYIWKLAERTEKRAVLKNIPLNGRKVKLTVIRNRDDIFRFLSVKSSGLFF